MKEILSELKGSMKGIIGAFVVGEDGDIIAQDVPELMNEAVGKVSKTLHHVTNVIKSTKSVDKLTVDSDNAKLISIPVDGRILVVITEKGINQPLFKLMSNMALSKIKSAPAAPAKPEAPSFDSGKICDLYAQLYGAAGKRLANIIGPKCASIFAQGAEGVEKAYPELLEGLSFGSTGIPDMIRIREKARQFSSKEKLIEALDELLLSMLDSVRKTAGPKQEQKALDEIEKLKSARSELL